jgi:5,10-methylene-tetrahydrofolate dehydrogenase/methenyl tetrahydrofolate cyclohydrolase/formiminotetrahydrofolate cyclodeaminase
MRWAEHAELHAESAATGRELAARLLDLADEDAEAYAAFAAARKLPKETEAEQQARRAATRAAARWASDVPMATLESCLAVVSAAESLAGRCNANAASDVGVAALLAEAAAQGAAANVLVNLPSVGDETYAAEMTQRVKLMVDDIQELAATTHETLGEASPASRSGREGLTRVPRGGARLLQGGPIAAEIRQAVSEDVAAYRDRHGRAPVLAVVICGRNALRWSTSSRSSGAARRSGSRAGWSRSTARRPRPARRGDRRAERRPRVNGIIVQMPLPPTIRLRSVVDAIDPAKDIDGIHPLNAGLLRLGYDGFLPATAHAAVEILRRSGIEIEGKRAVVVGRSAVVGMPAAFLLVRENATVTVCHSRTRDLPARSRTRRSSSSRSAIRA